MMVMRKEDGFIQQVYTLTFTRLHGDSQLLPCRQLHLAHGLIATDSPTSQLAIKGTVKAGLYLRSGVARGHSIATCRR